MAQSAPPLAPMGESDLPALFRSLDRTSVEAQQRYLRLVRLNLLVIVAGAAVSSLEPGNERWKFAAKVAGVVLFGVGLVLTIVLATQPYEKTWYGGRGGAESARTLAWRYMMRAHPFEGGEADARIDGELIAALRGILQTQELALRSGPAAAPADQITGAMRAVRALPVYARRAYYLEQRLDAQCAWYGARAEVNRTRSERWFYVMIASQALAFGAAVVKLAYPTIPVDLAAVFAAAASSALAWSHAKKFRELAQSYGIAAQDLGALSSLAGYVTSEPELSTFVADAEGAIVREHSLWVARRGAGA